MLNSNASIRYLDTALLVSVALLIVVGLVSIFSATHLGDSQASYDKFGKQFLWAVIGLTVMLAIVLTPLKIFYKYAYVFYGLSLLLLILTLVAGTGVGARRWLPLGPLSLQPSELAKVACLIALAKYLCRDNRNLKDVKEIVITFLIAFIPFLLIMKQPDLGSALVFLALILPMLHWGGLSPVTLFVLLAPVVSLVCAFNFYSFFAAILVVCIVLFIMQRGMIFFLSNFIINIGVGIVTPIIWELLKDYQKNRILTFLGLVHDPHGLGYQVIQSKVAIGSGGFWGKGFLDGTQTHLRFLPEQHTDFIFCVISEEFGFIGAFFVILLFLIMIFRGLNLASIVKSKFASLVVFGGSIIFLFQIFVNVGMTLGIMPVTGLPLPFLSYGGSSLLSNLIIIGLILNASRRRFEYF